MSDEGIGYVVQVFTARGLPPERSDFDDKAKAEKAFNDAKGFVIFWQTRPPTLGVGWVKLAEKDTPLAPPAPPKPAAPAASPKPAAPVSA